MRMILAAVALGVLAGPALAEAEPTGVAACDAFLEKYQACVTGKLPAAERPQKLEQIEQMRASWTAIAKRPSGKADLEAICKRTAGFIVPSLKPAGCEF